MELESGLGRVARNPLAHHHAILVVHFAQADVDQLAFGGRDDAAYVIGLNGQLPVAAVDQNAQFDALRPPCFSSASRAARVVRPV